MKLRGMYLSFIGLGIILITMIGPVLFSILINVNEILLYMNLHPLVVFLVIGAILSLIGIIVLFIDDN
jgi:MFS family permease